MISTEEINKTVVRRTRSLMLKENVNQTMLADWIGVTQQAIGQILQGRHTPKLWFIVGVAKVFRVSTDWLFGIEDDKR